VRLRVRAKVRVRVRVRIRVRVRVRVRVRIRVRVRVRVRVRLGPAHVMKQRAPLEEAEGTSLRGGTGADARGPGRATTHHGDRGDAASTRHHPGRIAAGHPPTHLLTYSPTRSLT
jgi:hypothetical protein